MGISYYKICFSLICTLISLAYIFRKKIQGVELRANVTYAVFFIGSSIILVCVTISFFSIGIVPKNIVMLFSGLSWYLSGVLGIGFGMTCSSLILVFLRLRR
jgi:hypothetical protein